MPSSIVIRTQNFRSFNSHTSKLVNDDGRIGVKTDHARRLGMVVKVLADLGEVTDANTFAKYFNRRYKTTSYTSNDLRTSLKRLESFGIVEFSRGPTQNEAWRLTVRGKAIWNKATIQ